MTQELHDDDKPKGRVLSRREALALIGASGAALIGGTWLTRLGGVQPAAALQAATATPNPSATPIPACVVRPELTEGPYFVDNMLERSDIRSEPSDGMLKEGALLRLTFLVSGLNPGGCQPIEGAQVDVWHCDAAGVYSGVKDPSFDTSAQSWLRGYQLTDKDGKAEFLTIYPGWYRGRTVHIHFKVRTDPQAVRGYEFTSQLFFDDAFTDKVYEQEPYASRPNRTPRNTGDGIFRGSKGLLTLDVTETDEDYAATFPIGLDVL